MFARMLNWLVSRKRVLVYHGDGRRSDRKVFQAFQNGAPVEFDGEVLIVERGDGR